MFAEVYSTRLSLINARHAFFNKCRCSTFRDSLHLNFIIYRCSDFLFSLDLNISWSTTPARVRPVLGKVVVGERALLGRAAEIILLVQQHVRLLRGLLLQRHEFLPRDRHRFDYSCYSVTRIAKQARRCKPKTAVATVEPNANDFFNKCRCSTFAYYQQLFHFMY